MIENWHDSPPPALPSPALTTKFFGPTDLKSVSSSEISPLPSSVCSPPATPMFAPCVHGITADEDTPDQSPTMPSPPLSTKIIRFNKSTSNEPHVLADTTNKTTTNTANKYSERGLDKDPERDSERGLERTSVVMVGNLLGYRYLNNNSSPITPYAVKNRIVANTPYRAPPLVPSRGPSCTTHVIQPSEKRDSTLQTPIFGNSVNPSGTVNKADGGSQSSFRSNNNHNNNTAPTPSAPYVNITGGIRPNTTVPTPTLNVSNGIRPTNDIAVPTPVTTPYSDISNNDPTVPTPVGDTCVTGSTSSLDSMMFQGVLELGLVPPWIPTEFLRPSVPGISYEEKRRSIEALFFMEEKPRENGIPTSIAPAFSVESIKHILWKLHLSEAEIKNMIDDLFNQESLETFEMWGRSYWRRKGAFSESKPRNWLTMLKC